MAIEFEVDDVIPAPPEIIFSAWLDSQAHSQMTGSPATASAEVGGEFTAWDGYIRGKNLELDPPARILQHWRTAEFEDADEDSLLEIMLMPEGDKTRVTIRQSNLPEHGMQYQQGWRDSYFEPMKRHFGA